MWLSQKGRILVSFAVLAELYEVLSRKRFRRYVDEEHIRTFLAALTREAQWVDVDAQITACRDPKDDKFLELAVSGQGTHIVTGDSDLLALNPFRALRFSLLTGSCNCCILQVPRLKTKPETRNQKLEGRG